MSRLAIFQTMQGFHDAMSDDMADGAHFAIIEDEIGRLMKEYGVTDTDSNSMMFEYFDWRNQQGGAA
ncbi:MAG: hypothetical protein VXW65_03870 [Pseudomonadota bacterium]|nr:hypothetical protein [Pseudomonadota bacterium]